VKSGLGDRRGPNEGRGGKAVFSPEIALTEIMGDGGWVEDWGSWAKEAGPAYRRLLKLERPKHNELHQWEGGSVTREDQPFWEAPQLEPCNGRGRWSKWTLSRKEKMAAVGRGDRASGGSWELTCGTKIDENRK